MTVGVGPCFYGFTLHRIHDVPYLVVALENGFK